MACGEWVSVASQRDAEQADIEKERREQAKGPAAQAVELDELTNIYLGRGLSYELARRCAENMERKATSSWGCVT
jgi:VIT1/CCC1 family predicted Fe2+/Mn2+ transporter